MRLREKRSKNLIDSFKHAFEGMFYSLKSVKNIKIHLSFTLLVLLGGFFFWIDIVEWFACLICIALVISLELLNSAIEEAVNLTTLEINERAKHAKDLAAGGVLVSAIISFIIGVIIFLPKVIEFIKELLWKINY